jgi:hypothetical protein
MRSATRNDGGRCTQISSGTADIIMHDRKTSVADNFNVLFDLHITPPEDRYLTPSRTLASVHSKVREQTG